MARGYEFKAIIHQKRTMDAAYIEFPWDIKKIFGKDKIVVQATIDGYRANGLLVRLGTTGHIMEISKEIQFTIGKKPGDEIFVTICERNED